MSSSLPVRFYLLILCGLLVANVTIYKTILAPRVLTVSVLEVGKGSAALVRTVSGATILVDTGPDASILRALGESLPEWQRTIDTVILTSGEGGQAGGLPDVMNRYRVANLIRFGAPGSKTFESVLAAAASTGLHQTTAPYGATLTLGTDSHLNVVSPGIFKISYSSGQTTARTAHQMFAHPSCQTRPRSSSCHTLTVKASSSFFCHCF